MVAFETDALDHVAEDFGHLVRGAPAGYRQASTRDDVVAAVQEAGSTGYRLTVRGLGHSFGGQALPDGSVVLDLSRLHDVEVDTDRQVVLCGAGATLRGVVAATLPQQCVPKVLTNLLDLTVGGLLSVGGIGPASQRYGPLVANVAAMDVVTGDGSLHHCSRTEERRLFDAMLCGLGRCGVIVGAELELRPISAHVRTFYLLYDDHGRWLADQQALAGTVNAMEGFCSPSPQGVRGTHGRREAFATWFYPLQVAVEYDESPPELPAGLSPYRVTHVEDDESQYFPVRHDVRFETMKRLGAWNRPHPCISAFIDAAALAKVLPDLLAEIPFLAGDAHRGLFFVDTQGAPPLFTTPAAQHVVFFTIMHAGVAPPVVDEATAAFTRVRDRLVHAGGIPYLVDWFGPVERDHLKSYFGFETDTWETDKTLFDPTGVFSSHLLSGTTSALD